MTRDLFVKVVAKAIRQSAGRTPEEQAEAVAWLMETVTGLVDGEPVPAARVAAPQPAPAAWPPINPEAVTAPPPEEPPQAQGPSLITLATRIPDRVEPAQAVPPPAAPLRSIQHERMKVEDLSRLIQERTPERLVFNVPLGDGSTSRVAFVRNVISMHAHDSVQLVYAPPNALPSAREACEVMAVLHVDEVPHDIPNILKKLAEQAIKAIAPRSSPIVSATPPVSVGPVTHGADQYKDPASVSNIQQVFNSMG